MPDTQAGIANPSFRGVGGSHEPEICSKRRILRIGKPLDQGTAVAILSFRSGCFCIQHIRTLVRWSSVCSLDREKQRYGDRLRNSETILRTIYRSSSAALALGPRFCSGNHGTDGHNLTRYAFVLTPIHIPSRKIFAPVFMRLHHLSRPAPQASRVILKSKRAARSP